MEEAYKPTLMQAQVSLQRKIAVSAGIMLVLILCVVFFSIPNPNMILIVGLVLCSALFGFGGGGVAALIMLFYTLYFFSIDHSLTRFTPENLQKVLTTLVGVATDMLLVCLLKHAEIHAFNRVEQLTRELHRENELLQNMSMKDALTGIRNRTALREDFNSYLNQEATVMMLDLNDFKSINDSLGHREGDRILRETGRLLADTFGEEHCYRYGGDEFLVIVPNLQESEFQQKLDRLMEQRPSVTLKGEHTQVGYSVGYVRALLDQPSVLRGLISSADERMYQKKRDRGPSASRRASDAPPQEPEARLRDTEYTVPELNRQLKRLSGEYDLVRVVDPIECRILELREDGTIVPNAKCYGIWKANQKCLNCSSAAACKTRQHQEKTEALGDQKFHIQSNPVTLKLPDGGVCEAVVELVHIAQEEDGQAANDRAAENVGGRAAHYQALHDNLTDVLNAGAFYELSREMLMNRSKLSWVMVTGSIMSFRLVNTLFGDQKGNEVLVKTAALLKALASRSNGLCGRLGGDQFAVLLPDSGYREDALRTIAQSLAEEFNSGIYTLCIHFGVYRVEDSSLPISVMCGRANSALHTIQDSLTQVVACFDDALMQRSLHEQMVISGFEAALEGGQFQMYLQPLMNEQGQVIGAEALARWCRPDGSILMPGVFIEILEQAGLIQKLDRYMWELAVRQLSLWKGTKQEHLTISVNISAKDFYSIDVYDVLTSLIEQYGVESRMLRLEITETALLVEPEKSDAVVAKLQERGFLVEINDFGRGYSSLSLLKNIHADVLKIDMGFLREIKDGRRSRVILESIIQMADSLGMEVISEGVETEEQLRTLSSMGCSHFQGYYFSHPIPVDAFEASYPAEQ